MGVLKLLLDGVIPVLAIYALWQYRSSELLRMREQYGTQGINLRGVFWDFVNQEYAFFRKAQARQFKRDLPPQLNELFGSSRTTAEN
jgi:hypothetical protein